MTEREALLWVLGILGSLCAAAITLDKVLDIIHKYVKKAKAPDDAQNARLDALELRLSAVEQGQQGHTAALRRDLLRFEDLEDGIAINLKATRAVLVAQLSGDNVDAMKQSTDEIDNYLFTRRKDTWKS